MNNEERAGRASAAVAAYWVGNSAEDLPTKVGDLICDLLHLLDMSAEPVFLMAVPPPEFDSGYRNPHAGSSDPVIVLARGLNHYLAEIHPEALVEGNRGEDAPLDPLPSDIDRAITLIFEFLRG